MVEKQTVEVVMLNYIIVAVAIIVIRAVWRRMPLPNRRWDTCQPSAEQLFSEADEKVTRQGNKV